MFFHELLNPMTDISIIIATHNRAGELANTLKALEQVDMLPDCELMVVDNASSDETKETVLASPLRLTYLYEPIPGKSHALNRAVRQAKGSLLVFTDDDVSPDSSWLIALHTVSKKHPSFDFFGGKVISKWSVTPPAWFQENYRWLGLTPTLDFGNQSVECNGLNRQFFLGANMAIRRRVFEEGIRYHADFGPKLAFGVAGSRHGAEDGLIQYDMLACGLKGLYVPNAIIHHRDDPLRMTKSYLRWYYMSHAREEVLCGSLPSTGPKWFGAPRYLWKSLIKSGAGWLLTRCMTSSRIWLPHEVSFIKSISQIRAFREKVTK